MQVIKINTSNGTLEFTDGRVATYDLLKQKTWNIGRRRHINDLTGKIRVDWPNASGEHVYRVFSSFDSIRNYNFR